MKVLLIDACIRKESRTRLLCRAYLSKRYSEADTIMERCLTSMGSFSPLDERMLSKREQDCCTNDFSSSEYQMAKEFAEADEILIGAPCWDCSFPAILKVYLEHICVNGITFGYDENGNVLKMCRAERLVYITTAGGYSPEQNSVKMYLQELCKMFGIPELSYFSAQGLDIIENDTNELMKQATIDIGHLADLNRKEAEDQKN